MPRSVNQKMKMLYVADILKRKTDEDHGLSMAEIISMLENLGISAERKSLYDDFQCLREFGLDVEKKTEGGHTLYYVANRDFELAELKLLVDAVQSSKFITEKKSSALIKKIEALASEHQARFISKGVKVANRIKTMNETIYYAVDDIQSAMEQNRQISFQYFNWNEKKEKILRHGGKTYQVSPWALTWDDENYYMVAFDSENGEIRHYRVDKMLRIRILDEKRGGAASFRNFDMALYSRKTFGMNGGEELQVTLRCQNDMAGIMIDRFGHDLIMWQEDDEHFCMSARVFASSQFITWLMNFNDRITIISPESVITKYVELGRSVLERYGR